MTLRRWRSVRPRARHRVLLAAWLLASASACGTAALVDEPPLDPNDPNEALETAPATIELAPLTVNTYDGSGEFVHPDAYVFPSKWRGRRYWFAATPYPAGNSAMENPSVFLATRSTAWDAPAGVINPLARPAADTYLSDPDLQHDPARDELRLYYRQTSREQDQVLVTTSGDGQRWGAPHTLLTATRYSLISPAIVREERGDWRMWTVNPGSAGCRARAADVVLSVRHSADGLAWEPPSLVTLDIPGFAPWHWDVQYVAARHEYWALVAAYPDQFDCSYTSVFFARSADGVTWKVSPSPLLTSGTATPVRNVVYRSTFHYHPGSDAVTVWYSGAHTELGGYVFGGATARYAMSDLLQRVGRSIDVAAMVHHARILDATPADSAARSAFVRRFP